MAFAPQRLKRRREFLHVARAGRKWAAPGLVLQALNRRTPATNSAAEGIKENDVRLGFTVTRKVGNAVVRNRVRRRLRAAAETVIPSHAAPGHDFVVIGRAGTIRRPFTDLVGDLESALKKLDAWEEETPNSGDQVL